MKTDQSPDSARKQVLTITVSYRSAAWTSRSLHALSAERARCPDIDIRSIVVDNASGDAVELSRLIEEQGWGDWVTLLVAERNGGFAYGNNVGFRHAYCQPRPPDFFYLLNPDAEVRPQAIAALVDFLESNPGAGLAASSIEDESGAPWPYAFRFPSLASELEAGMSFGPISRLLRNHSVLRRMDNLVEAEAVDWFPGAAMMVRREVVDAVGGMDESYFLYFEETDYLLRCREAGWTAWYVPRSRVVHTAGQSTGVTAKRESPARLPDYWFESRRRYFLKNHGVAYAAAVDVVALVSSSVGGLKRQLQGKKNVPHFVRDLARHAVLRAGNRTVAPVRQFVPVKN